MTAGQEAGRRLARTDGAPAWPSPPDPGDLSRRLVQRRSELGLTADQVAARATVSPRYLEFLERYPGRPDRATLRRLAAALRTSPSALLGGGLGAAPAGSPVSGPGVLERIPPAECRGLIAPGGVGRIGFLTASGIVMLPVNFVVIANTIVVRTGAGSVIAAHADQDVTFEADRIDEALGEAWSVLVQGRAHGVIQHAELARMQRGPAIVPWPAGQHDLYIRITPRRITGRRIVHR